jgi:dihydrolipoamide dehydrogenase
MYDLFVIGGGPGGYTAALLAAKKGLKVGIAEGAQFGGTCTNTGCIPTKTYIESIKLLSKINSASRFGIESAGASLTLGSLNKRKARIVSRLVKGIEYLLSGADVDIYNQTAEIIDAATIKVGEKILDARALIVATGSRPIIPEIFDAPGLWTSDTLFDVKDMPDSLAIVGGGVIGMEMAHIFSTLGAAVTVIEAMDRILPFEDPQVSQFLVKNSRKVKMFTSSKVADIQGETPYTIKMDTPDTDDITLTADKILLCIGRYPVIPQGLAKLGIGLNSSGGIQVDDTMQTSVPGVYAIGDVTGEHMYAYVASKEAEVAVDHLTGGNQKINYRNIPSIIFTSPEIASVGKSLAELDQSNTKHGLFPLSALGRARTMEANEGYAHIVCSESGRIERVTIVSPHATELITIATLAIDKGLTVKDFLSLYHPHPTLSEILKEAAEDVLGLSIHKP